MRGVTEEEMKQSDGFKFQLTRLMRGVTALGRRLTYRLSFQLTRLMRGVTEYDLIQNIINEYFNSHASCEA